MELERPLGDPLEHLKKGRASPGRNKEQGMFTVSAGRLASNCAQARKVTIFNKKYATIFLTKLFHLISFNLSFCEVYHRLGKQ